MKYRIGTRGSALARIQAESVRARLAAEYPQHEFEIVPIATAGDRMQDRPFPELGESAPFVREIELALIERRVDLAVHSMKDLAGECAKGLVLSKAWKRDDPRDALVLREGAGIPRNGKVATGSARRSFLLRKARPDVEIVSMRGNVDTRLRKLRSPGLHEERIDAIVLACAGLRRLGREDAISRPFTVDEMLPAANQGQLAIELRAGDLELKGMLGRLGDDRADAIARAERGFLAETGADCHVPVGAYAEFADGGGIRLRALFARGIGGEGAFADVTAPSPEAAVRKAADEIRRQIAGEVVLVGAGPGDPDLVTVKGLDAIRRADAIVYDRLASGKLLEKAKAGCRLVYAGKASGNHSMPQPETNALLAKLALENDLVVRLKGGDPFVFGRGGEEMEYLVSRSIRCSSIPGVTSAVAAAESARIPVTHRGVANGFEVVTAHCREGEDAGLDFGRMLDAGRTYVFLMGLARIGEIARGLVAAGRDKATPAAAVSSATTKDERCVAGTLENIAARAEGLVSPAILIVGDAVALRKRLGLPFSGRRFLVPAIEGGSRSLGEKLRALGAQTDEPAVGRIERIDGALEEKDLDGIDRIVVTSANGYLGIDGRVRGWMEKRGIALERVRKIEPKRGTLHLTQPDADRVEGVKSIDVYRNVPVAPAGAIDLARYDGAFFTCASSARRVLAAATGKTAMLAIGEKTAAALAGNGIEPAAVAKETSVDSLVAAALEIF